jgi:bacterioferritin
MHNSGRFQGSVMPQPSDNNATQAYDKSVAVDSVVLGFLGRALSLEWSFGQNCLTQAALAKSRGEMNIGQHFIDFANKEFQHANILVDRIVASGMIPASSVLQPSVGSTDTQTALQSAWQFKNTQINLYLEAANYCLTHSFVSDNKLFNTLLQEEQEQLMHIQSLLQ